MLKNFSKKLMIVAHPDDESLFGGAQLITEGGWKVICVTNGDNPIRRAEFEEVMYVTNSKYEMWDYHDEYHVPLEEENLLADLERVIKEETWEKIVTHNQYGDYGHPHHKQVHFLVKKIVNNFLVFDFFGKQLPDKVWQEKLNLINIYEIKKEICDGHIPNVKTERVVRNFNIF